MTRGPSQEEQQILVLLDVLQRFSEDLDAAQAAWDQGVRPAAAEQGALSDRLRRLDRLFDRMLGVGRSAG